MIDVKVPKMGMSTVEVDLMKWQVTVGDEVEVGTILAEIESEKTAVDIEAEVSGRVAEILVREGETIEVGTVLCRIEEAT